MRITRIGTYVDEETLIREIEFLRVENINVWILSIVLVIVKHKCGVTLDDFTCHVGVICFKCVQGVVIAHQGRFHAAGFISPSNLLVPGC